MVSASAERELKEIGGVRVVVLMRRVAVGRTAGGEIKSGKW